MNNQQYEGKSLTFNACTTGITVSHCFDCVFTDCNFINVATGLDMTVSSIGSVILLDSTATNSGTIVNTNSESTGDHTLVIENFSKGSGITSVVSASGVTILNSNVPDTWVYGNSYTAGGPPSGSPQTSTTYTIPRPASLLRVGKYLTVPPPTYADVDVSQVINVKSVSGLPVFVDGKTDDTANLNAVISKFAASNVLFFPQGTYIVMDTIFFPKGSRVVGEAWSAISALGSRFFNPQSPVPMVRDENVGDVGVAQFSDMLFIFADVLQGCTLLEVNMAGENQANVGFWNTHFRVGNAAGSKVQTNCGGSPASCPAAFAFMHLTASSSAYIENKWDWTTGHDIDGGRGQTIATARGILIEATSATWLHGTASEHNTLYQYNFNNAANVFVGMQQSETAYWQGVGSPSLASASWATLSSSGDPTFTNCKTDDPQCRMGWFARISGSSNVSFYGAGFWTFFNDNDGSCQSRGVCQTNAINIRNNTSIAWFGINVKDNVNVIDNNGVALVTEQNNSGGSGGFGRNGAVVGAFLADERTGGPTPPPPPPGKHEQAVYWGQNDNEKDLGNYCQSSQGIGIIVLSFLSNYGNGKTPSGSFGDCLIDNNGKGQNCEALANGIATCQAAARRSFSASAGMVLPVPSRLKQTPRKLQSLCGIFTSVSVQYPMPFALRQRFRQWIGLRHRVESANNRQNCDNTNYKFLVNKLSSFFPQDPSQTYAISGAPQCLLPEANMGDMIDNAQFDYLFIQFYNNESCSTYPFVRPDGREGDGFNFDEWESQIKSHASKGARLLVGLPSSQDASTGHANGGKYFLSPGELKTVVQELKARIDFAGVILWNAGERDGDVNAGCEYDQEARSVLDTGESC